MIKKATGVRGYLMKVPVMNEGEFARDANDDVIFKTVFRVYDEEKQFKDYEISVYDLEIEIKDKHCVICEGPNGNLVDAAVL